jgi:hypothetical protein
LGAVEVKINVKGSGWGARSTHPWSCGNLLKIVGGMTWTWVDLGGVLEVLVENSVGFWLSAHRLLQVRRIGYGGVWFGRGWGFEGGSGICALDFRGG